MSDDRTITIDDVAKLAGVSRATAGRVVGNYGSVSEKSRERVWDAVRQLDYQPNLIARGLRSQTTKTIAVIVGSMAEDGFPKAPRFICGGSYEWPKEVADIVQDAFVNKVDMVGLNRLNYLCGAVFAEKAAQFMKENNIDSRNIKVLGLDTQTIYQEQPNHAAIAKMTKEEKDDWVGRWLSGTSIKRSNYCSICFS